MQTRYYYENVMCYFYFALIFVWEILIHVTFLLKSKNFVKTSSPFYRVFVISMFTHTNIKFLNKDTKARDRSIVCSKLFFVVQISTKMKWKFKQYFSILIEKYFWIKNSPLGFKMIFVLNSWNFTSMWTNPCEPLVEISAKSWIRSPVLIFNYGSKY